MSHGGISILPPPGPAPILLGLTRTIFWSNHGRSQDLQINLLQFLSVASHSFEAIFKLREYPRISIIFFSLNLVYYCFLFFLLRSFLLFFFPFCTISICFFPRDIIVPPSLSLLVSFLVLLYLSFLLSLLFLPLAYFLSLSLSLYFSLFSISRFSAFLSFFSYYSWY